MDTRSLGKTLFSYAVILIMAFLLALNYYVFVIENHFAPAGINGIATMIQYKTGLSLGWFSLAVNLPLCAVAFFLVERKYALRSLTFAAAYSLFYLLLQRIAPVAIQYDAGGHDTIFPALISGAVSGFIIGVCLRHHSASGGMEIVSRCVHTVRPRADFFKINFALNAAVAAVSLFVFSDGGALDYKPVALCITYCFTSNLVGSRMTQGAKTAFKFTVITTHPEEITAEVTRTLRHGVTKIEAAGGYTGSPNTVLLCVISKHQVAEFREILSRYDGTFSFCETVNETCGNFAAVPAGLFGSL